MQVYIVIQHKARQRQTLTRLAGIQPQFLEPSWKVAHPPFDFSNQDHKKADRHLPLLQVSAERTNTANSKYHWTAPPSPATSITSYICPVVAAQLILTQLNPTPALIALSPSLSTLHAYSTCRHPDPTRDILNQAFQGPTFS